MTPSHVADPAAEEDLDTQPDEPNGEPEGQPTSASEAEGSESPEAPPATASDTAEPSDGGEEGGEQPDSTPEAQPAAEEPDEHVEATPFAFRFHGRSLAVPDAVETPYGIVMSREAFNRTILPRLRDPEEIAQRESQFTTKIRELETAQNEEVLRARALVEEVDALLEDPDRLAQFAADYERNRELLTARIENRILKAQKVAPQATVADSFDEEGQIRSLAEQLPSWLDTGIEALTKEPDVAALGLTSQQLYDLFWPLRGQVFTVDERGQYAVDLAFMRSHLAPMVARIKALTAGQQKQVAAAKHNARALGQPQKAPPPVAGAKGSPAATPAPWKPKTREEYEAGLAKLARGEDFD